MLRLLQCLVGLLLIASGLSSLEVVREVKDELEHLEDKSQHKVRSKGIYSLYETPPLKRLLSHPVLSLQLRFDINPGCPAESCSLNQSLISVVNLTVYDSPVAAVEHHWIWSVIGRPTVQLALTQPQDEAEIDWAALLGMTESIDSSIVYSQSPKYSAAIMLANVSFPGNTIRQMDWLIFVTKY